MFVCTIVSEMLKEEVEYVCVKIKEKEKDGEKRR